MEEGTRRCRKCGGMTDSELPCGCRPKKKNWKKVYSKRIDMLILLLRDKELEAQELAMNQEKAEGERAIASGIVAGIQFCIEEVKKLNGKDWQ